MKIILASASPRRQELMKNITSSFEVIIKPIDESKSYSLSPINACQDISYRKAKEVSKDHPSDLIIAADTIVTIDDLIIGKPKTIEEARSMLKLLSNRTHQVLTGYTIFYNNKYLTNFVTTDVTFALLSEELIEAYIKTGSPFDKAGGYGIQDNEHYPLISNIQGSYENVLGFPSKEIKKDIEILTNKTTI